MDLSGWRRKQLSEGTIKLAVRGTLANRIRALHAESIVGTEYGGRTSIEQYVMEILDAFVVDQRSNRLRDDPSRHYARNGCDADHVIE